MKYVVCYSGGHSSAIAAIETVRRYGKDNVILLNHDISANVEDIDIKRFKQEIADYLGLEITYANAPYWSYKDPLDVCEDAGGFSPGNGQCYCTNRLKTKPFKAWLKHNYPSKPFEPRDDIIILYGFDINEQHRIQRRIGIMFNDGYKTDYPLVWEHRTIYNTEEIGIVRPSTYNLYKHANCVGCIKAGQQSWYVTYCLRPDIFERAKILEQKVGHSILKNAYLADLECKFRYMENVLHIFPDEHVTSQKFWSDVNKMLPDDGNLPCECAI
jgi:hypothetical protein